MTLGQPVGHILSGDANLDRQLRAVTDKIHELEESPLANTVLLTGVELTTTEATVRHGLGSRPRGYLVVRQNASASVYEATDAPDLRNQINLTASATVTVDLLVF